MTNKEVPGTNFKRISAKGKRAKAAFTKAGEKTAKTINPEKDLVFGKTWTDGRIAPVARLQNWWAKSIRSGEPMIPGLAEGLVSQKVCDRLRESSESGQRLSIG